MKRTFAILAAGAVLQLAIPAQAANPLSGRPVMVALCGGGAPIPLPMKNHGSDNLCCKICHSAMRKRHSGDNCCFEDGGEDEE